MIMKEAAWCDNGVVGLLRRVRLSARDLKVGVLRLAPVCRTEQEGAGISRSEKAENDKKDKKDQV